MKKFTIGELISMVRGNIPKDHILYKSTTDRYIYNVLLALRYKLLSDEIASGKNIKESEYSILPCVETTKVSTISCECLKHLSCSFIYRTLHKIPKPFYKKGEALITKVFSVDGIEYQINSATRKIYDKGLRYTGNRISVVYENEFLYFYGGKVPEVVTVKLVAEDLEAVENFPNYCLDKYCKECPDCGEEFSVNPVSYNCKSMYERLFPIDKDKVDTLVGLARERIFNVKFEDGTEQKRRGDNPEAVQQGEQEIQ